MLFKSVSDFNDFSFFFLLFTSHGQQTANKHALCERYDSRLWGQCVFASHCHTYNGVKILIMKSGLCFWDPMTCSDKG